MKDWLVALLISTVAVFAPIKALLLTTGIVIFADLIIGILAARKRGEQITSSGINRTIVKLLVAEVAILLAYLIETFMLEGFIPMTQILGGLIGIKEAKSILENLNDFYGGDIFKELIKKLGSVNDKID